MIPKVVNMGTTSTQMHILLMGVASSLLLVVTSAPIDKNQEDIKYLHFNDGLGHSRFSYELPDGTTNEQNINTIKLGTEKLLTAMGKYSYRFQGIIVTMVDYVADDNGYRPQVTIYNIALIRYDLPTKAIITLQGGIG